MGNQRKAYTSEYKDEAVKLVINTGRPIATVARELGIVEQTLGNWVKAFRDRQQAGDGALSESERAELVRLRRENTELKMDRAFLKKSVALLRPGSIGYEREAFKLMRVEKSTFTIKRKARLLEVSRSGFYAWLKREPSARAVRTERIEQKICWFHGASDEVYGSPKILADLRDDGEKISRKTVAKIMRGLGLRGISPKRWKTTTLIDRADAYPIDAVKREWDTGDLDQVWVGVNTDSAAWTFAPTMYREKISIIT